MDFFTHLVFGGLMYLLFLKEVTFEYVLLAMFFAILPDLDIFIMPLRKIFKSNYLEHRGGSHSYITGVIISFIISVVISVLTQRPFLFIWLIGIIFYGLHVSMDLLTTTKIPYLYPLSKKELSFYVEKAGSQFTMLNSVILIIVLISLYNASVTFFTFIAVINFYTFFYIMYYLIRIASKLLVSSKLNENQKYFPGVLPFYFIIYEYEIVGNEISLGLKKKSHFSKTDIIYKNQSALNSEEMTFFQKGMELCSENYYFAKWTLLPIFIRNDGKFSVRFFFLEPMMHRRAMNIQFDFDILTQQLIRIKRGYGRIQ
ncbi:MAG: hypothetical protein Lokiarch_07290 [Candidatus Lokiarchaeum sp. GC14_75]|nr:MAG: hypothetical protein Lokiarch_07290 [Candidatus Lokiarchaeum sp. GC14_75]